MNEHFAVRLGIRKTKWYTAILAARDLQLCIGVRDCSAIESSAKNKNKRHKKDTPASLSIS